MRLSLSRLLAFALFVWAGASAHARDFPVASREEFDAAVAAAKPGDSIVWASGTYRDVKLALRTQGSASDPVRLRAAVPGETRFEGSSQLVLDGKHLAVSGLAFQKIVDLPSKITPYDVTVASVITFTARASHCQLTQTFIVDSGEGVTIYVHLEPGNTENRIDHCWFSNQGRIGVTFYVEVDPHRPNGHLIAQNYFGDRQQGTGNRWETLRIGHSEQQRFVSNTTVTKNYFYRCNGENECVSNKSTGNSYLYNTFIEVRGELALRHGDRTRVEGNYFYGGAEPKAGGVRIIGSDQVVVSNYFRGLRQALVIYNGQSGSDPRDYAPVENALVAFNTFDDCTETFTFATNARPVRPKNVRLIGNLVRAREGKIFRSAPGVDVAYTGNVMFGTELGLEGGVPNGIVHRAPAFEVDAWDRLVPDREVTLPLASLQDIKRDLNSRPRAERTTIGAIQSPASAPLYPRSRADVGPAWMKQPASAPATP